MSKHELIEKLIKEGHITFDEALILVDKEPIGWPHYIPSGPIDIRPFSPTVPYSPSPVFPDYPYPSPYTTPYPGTMPVICSTTLNITCQR